MDWAAFFDMGGRGFYVWGAYGMAFLVFAIEIALVRHKRAATLQQLRELREAGE